MQGCSILEWLASENGKHIARLEKLCARMGQHTGENADDMYGRAIDILIEHGEQWTARHDATKQSLCNWLLVCVGFMLRTRKAVKFEMLTDQMESRALSNIEGQEDTPAPDSLSNNLESLNGYDRWLIVSRHVHNVNFTTIADGLGVSKGTVRTHYLRAIERAKGNTNNGKG